MRIVLLAGLALVLGGCSITQNIKPVAAESVEEVCIVSNPAVRPGFLSAYQQTLAKNGYSVTQLSPDSALTSCPVVSTYHAQWSWDLALYMSLAEIVVYRDGQEAGRANYDSTGGSFTFSKFIDAEEKIAELATGLFPPRARP